MNRKLAKCKLILEYYDWELFYKLLSRLYSKKWKGLFKFLASKDQLIRKVKSEEEFINQLEYNDKKVYLDFIQLFDKDSLRCS